MLTFNIVINNEGAKLDTDPKHYSPESYLIQDLSEIKKSGSEGESEGEDQEEKKKEMGKSDSSINKNKHS